MTQPTTTTLLTDLARARRKLYALLRTQDPRALAKRPPSGKWSIIENVRHLIFAEQAHLGRFLPDALAWNVMSAARKGKAFTTKGGAVTIHCRERQLVPEYTGAQPKNDLEAVLAAWDLIHKPIRKAIKEQPGTDAQQALDRHLPHLLRHIEVIEKQLRATSRQ